MMYPLILLLISLLPSIAASSDCTWNRISGSLADNNLTLLANQLDSCPDPVGILGYNGESLLHFAASRPNLAACQLLVKRKFDVNARDSRYRTPLFEARSEEVIDFLLDHGADPTVIGDNGIQVLTYFIYMSNTNLVEYLLKDKRFAPRTEQEWSVIWRTASQQLSPGWGYDMVSILLQHGGDAKWRWPDGKTLLHRHGGKNAAKTIRLLVKSGADPNLPDRDGTLPLHLYAQAPDMNAIAALVESGADPFLQTRRKETPYELSLLRRQERVSTYFESTIPAERLKNSEISQHALELAVEQWDSPLVFLLLDRGFTSGNMGRILESAIRSGKYEQVKAVVGKGADLSIKASDGTSLLMASLRGYVDLNIVQQLLPFTPDMAETLRGDSLLFHAIKTKNPDIVTALLEAGAPVKCFDRDGNTPLFVSLDSIPILKTLLEHGADVNEPGYSFEIPPLFHAVQYSTAETVQLLIDHGALFTVPRSKESLLNKIETPEMLQLLLKNGFPLSTDGSFRDNIVGNAVARNRYHLMLEAVRHGAPVNVTNPEGELPLHYFLKFRRPSPDSDRVFQALTVKGVDLNQKDRAGWTPLAYCPIEWMDTLIEKGAKVNLVGNSPLHHACENNQLERAKVLIAKGADANALNDYGFTPLDLVCNKNYALSELLFKKGGKYRMKVGYKCASESEF